MPPAQAASHETEADIVRTTGRTRFVEQAPLTFMTLQRVAGGARHLR